MTYSLGILDAFLDPRVRGDDVITQKLCVGLREDVVAIKCFFVEILPSNFPLESVIPAHAGIQNPSVLHSLRNTWVPPMMIEPSSPDIFLDPRLRGDDVTTQGLAVGVRGDDVTTQKLGVGLRGDDVTTQKLGVGLRGDDVTSSVISHSSHLT